MAIDDGGPATDYARMFGVDDGTIVNWRKNGGKKDRYRIPKEDLDYALERLKAGDSYKGLAKELGVSDTALRNRFPGYGAGKGVYTASKLQPVTEPDVWQRAKYFLDDGCSYREVAKTLGLNRDSIVERFPGYQWSSAQSTQFSAKVSKIKKKMPKNYQRIFYGYANMDKD